MDLQELLGAAPKQPEQPKRDKWDKHRDRSQLIILASSSCFAVQLARIYPLLAPVVGLIFAAGALGIAAWAMLTPGDQRLQISLTTIAVVFGVSLGLRDAIALLQLMGIQAWLGVGLVAVIFLAVFALEGRSGAKRN